MWQKSLYIIILRELINSTNEAKLVFLRLATQSFHFLCRSMHSVSLVLTWIWILKMSHRKIAKMYCIVDLICFGLVGLANLLLHVTNVQPSNRGFHCNDESLNYPYKSETISTLAALFIGLGLGIVTVRLAQFIKDILDIILLPFPPWPLEMWNFTFAISR